MSSSEIEKRAKFLKKKETQKFIKDVLHQQEPLTKEQSEELNRLSPPNAIYPDKQGHRSFLAEDNIFILQEVNLLLG